MNMSDIKRYSASQVKVFTRNCPAALKFYHEAKEEPDIREGPRAAEFGTCFHALAHACGLAEKESKPLMPAIDATALVLTRKHNAAVVRAAVEVIRDFNLWW